jgi:hypothetical protein
MSPTCDDAARVRLVGLKPVGALFGRDRTLAFDGVGDDRSNQAGLPAERLVDRVDGDAGGLGDGGHRRGAYPTARNCCSLTRTTRSCAWRVRSCRREESYGRLSVGDVADLVVQVVLDATYRGRIIEIGGPRELTLNELVVTSREVTGGPARVRHLPRTLLRALAPLHRQPRSALVMDTRDMTYEPGPDATTGPAEPQEALRQFAASTRHT